MNPWLKNAESSPCFTTSNFIALLQPAALQSCLQIKFLWSWFYVTQHVVSQKHCFVLLQLHWESCWPVAVPQPDTATRRSCRESTSTAATLICATAPPSGGQPHWCLCAHWRLRCCFKVSYCRRNNLELWTSRQNHGSYTWIQDIKEGTLKI